jgi:hypothetical protein
MVSEEPECASSRLGTRTFIATPTPTQPYRNAGLDQNTNESTFKALEGDLRCCASQQRVVVVEHHTRTRTRARHVTTAEQDQQKQFGEASLHCPRPSTSQDGREDRGLCHGGVRIRQLLQWGAQMGMHWLGDASQHARGCINLDEASRAQCHSDSSNPLTRTNISIHASGHLRQPRPGPGRAATPWKWHK